MNIEEIRSTPEEMLKEYTRRPQDSILSGCEIVANAATDKAVKSYDRELRPYLEDIIEVLSNAQGEWYSVTKTYAPEWTHPFKEIESLIDEALKKLVEELA